MNPHHNGDPMPVPVRLINRTRPFLCGYLSSLIDYAMYEKRVCPYETSCYNAWPRQTIVFQKCKECGSTKILSMNHINLPALLSLRLILSVFTPQKLQFHFYVRWDKAGQSTPANNIHSFPNIMRQYWACIYSNSNHSVVLHFKHHNANLLPSVKQ